MEGLAKPPKVAEAFITCRENNSNGLGLGLGSALNLVGLFIYPKNNLKGSRCAEGAASCLKVLQKELVIEWWKMLFFFKARCFTK